MSTKIKYQYREEWLNELVKLLQPLLNKKLPKYRITCGFPSSRALSSKRKTIGECFYAHCSDDKTHELIISMTIDDPIEVAATTMHEMIHAVCGHEVGHKKPFKDLALAVGLEGKMTATVAGDAFKQSVKPILKKLGPYPHASIKAEDVKRKKQSTRLFKAECLTCGYNVRVTRKWFESIGAPYCAIKNHGRMVIAS